MAEWSKALVLGTNHICGVGSNPTAAKFFFRFATFFLITFFEFFFCSVISSVYQTVTLPSKHKIHSTFQLFHANHTLHDPEEIRHVYVLE